jgi:DNA modification methylase
MKVEVVPIVSVVPYARNPRKNAAAVAKVAASIKEFGWRQPIVVDSERVIIAGHTRLLAALHLGLREVPVHVAEGLTPAQVKAYRLADNRVGEEAEWDADLLALEFGDLQGLDFDLSLTGFDPDEIAGAMVEGLQADPDAVPDASENPVTLPGDLIQLGRHRLLCGDSTVSTDVDKVLAGVAPTLMVTDPPYGVEYDPDWRNRAERPNGAAAIGRAIGRVQNDDRNDWREAWALFPGDVVYCWHAGRHASSVQSSLEAAGFEIRCQIVWAKSRFAIGRGDYHWQHEPCWYAVRSGKKGHWQGSRSESTLWQIQHLKSETGHSTQKPVECMRRPVENNSSPGQAVYDPFLGSGTTLIACEMSGRACYGLEINPAYCDVIVARWEQATGQKAVRPTAGVAT